MRCRVIKSTGSWYKLITEKNTIVDARARGKIRLKEFNTTNPIAVGDWVIAIPENENSANYVITEIENRHNYIIRKSNKLSKQRQILATNIDLHIIVASLVSPITSLGFIDRLLLCSEAFHIPAILFLNKVDLIGNESKETIQELMQLYASIGYETIVGSAKEQKTINSIKEKITGKTTLLSGHSGAGKSTLMNYLFPNANAKVGDISNYHEKGKHTTTFAEMYCFENKTNIIDTPGIREFGLMDIEPKEIAQYFPEFTKLQPQCKFNNCIHINEPECAIKTAVENNIIHISRYSSYLSMYANDDVFQ